MTPRSRTRSAMMLGNRQSSMMGLSTMQSSPKWTLMGRRTNSVGKRNESRPDPGAYSSSDPSVTSKMNRSPKAAFGSLDTGRLSIEKERVPGPGAYNNYTDGTYANSTSALIYSGPSREQRPRGHSRESTPDPGLYGIHEVTNTSKMSRNPSYGFASSRADRFPTLKDRAPGPGSYQHKDILGDSSNGKFLGSPRNPERRRGESPDPGSYLARDPSHTSKMSSSPRAGFGNLDTGRTTFLKEATPGPGAYTHREAMSEQTTTFGSSTRLKGAKPMTEVPPPGNYNTVDPTSTSKMMKQTGYGWGSSDTGRFWGEDGLRSKVNGSSVKLSASPKTPRGNIPGPGSYNVVDYNVPQRGGSVRGFGTDTRPSSQNMRTIFATPGPGTYVKDSHMGSGPKFTMRSRSVERLKSSPGPGEYGVWSQFV